MGSHVIRELLSRGADVRALFRSKEAVGKLPEPVEPATGDLLDPESVRKAMACVNKLYLLNAVVPDELTQGLIAYDLARRLKLGQVVYHSVFQAERFPDVPHFASRAAIEAALKAFDVQFTIIRPNYFYQNSYVFQVNTQARNAPRPAPRNAPRKAPISAM